jgi:hypothetical protein
MYRQTSLSNGQLLAAAEVVLADARQCVCDLQTSIMALRVLQAQLQWQRAERDLHAAGQEIGVLGSFIGPVRN